MKKFFLFLTFLILFLVQTTFDDIIKIFGVVPNLLLVFTIIYSVNSSVISSVFIGAVAGFLIDVSSGGIVGINAILMTYTGVCVSILSSRILYERKLITCITVFFVGFIYETLSLIVSNLFITSLPVFYITYRYTLISCVYNTILAFPLISLINRLKFEYIRGI